MPGVEGSSSRATWGTWPKTVAPGPPARMGPLDLPPPALSTPQWQVGLHPGNPQSPAGGTAQWRRGLLPATEPSHPGSDSLTAPPPARGRHSVRLSVQCQVPAGPTGHLVTGMSPGQASHGGLRVGVQTDLAGGCLQGLGHGCVGMCASRWTWPPVKPGTHPQGEGRLPETQVWPLAAGTSLPPPAQSPPAPAVRVWQAGGGAPLTRQNGTSHL